MSGNVPIIGLRAFWNAATVWRLNMVHYTDKGACCKRDKSVVHLYFVHAETKAILLTYVYANFSDYVKVMI